MHSRPPCRSDEASIRQLEGVLDNFPISAARIPASALAAKRIFVPGRRENMRGSSGISARSALNAIAAGARSPRAVHAHHQTKINCGKCCETVCDMIRTQAQDEVCSSQHVMVAAE